MGSKEVEQDFCTELREKTQTIHDQSDKLINLKLAVVLTDMRLYGQCLADFYYVFQTIENSIGEARNHPHVWPLFIQLTQGMSRVDAFEKDLQYYLGTKWNAVIEPSAAAKKYCDRIIFVASDNPTLLIAYAHSMWLALLAGGQIIKKVVKKTLGLSGMDGLSVYEYPDGLQRQVLRKQLIATINDIDLNRSQKDEVISEKMMCFRMNNTIANSVEPSLTHYNRIFKFMLLVLFVLVFSFYMIYMLVT